MAKIKIKGRLVDVNLREEIEMFEFDKVTWRGDKMTACSPFRYDSTPSFFLNVEEGDYAGTWKDSGAYDDEYASGNFQKLLSFLRNESYEETVDYLLAKYDYEYMDTSLSLDIEPLYIRKSIVTLDESLISKKPLDKTYLDSRGIHPKIVELNGVFDNGNSIGIVWRDINGRIATIKYRHKQSKIFWYEKEATPVNRLVYGINHVVERDLKRIVLCEAEIDAMTWQSVGIFAVAVGGASLNDIQAQLIASSGVDEVILGGDFDEAGERFNSIAYEKLRMYIPSIKKIKDSDKIPFKDVNEFGTINVKRLEFESIPIVKELII